MHDDEKEINLENLWPRNGTKADAAKIFEIAEALAAEISDPKAKEEIAQAKKRYEQVKDIADSESEGATLVDMPESVLDGRLGEMCFAYMLGKFPIAYAWPSLVTTASIMVPRYGEKQRINLYTALVGPVHSGKTQAIDTAQQLLNVEPPALMNVMAGSAESLMRHCNDAGGNPRLFSPDELGHLLEKAKIQNASFTTVLSRAFYHDKFTILMQQKVKAEFNASLSILGGLVDSRFEDLFSASTTAGLYDRFLFGACPGGFLFKYAPFEGRAASIELSRVGVHPEVWEAKNQWSEDNPEIEQRVAELAIRIAIICASFDGKTLLRAVDLEPAKAMAEYQTRIRRSLKPNEGENIDGKVTLKIISYLKRLNGKYVSRRSLLRDIGAYRFGPVVADRILSTLHSNGDIEITKKRPVLVRTLSDTENGDVPF
jgi:hypothetical protein